MNALKQFAKCFIEFVACIIKVKIVLYERVLKFTLKNIMIRCSLELAVSNSEPKLKRFGIH